MLGHSQRRPHGQHVCNWSYHAQCLSEVATSLNAWYPSSTWDVYGSGGMRPIVYCFLFAMLVQIIWWRVSASTRIVLHRSNQLTPIPSAHQHCMFNPCMHTKMVSVATVLTFCSMMTHIFSRLGYRWSKYWLVPWSAPKRYINVGCWIVNWTTRIKSLWNLKQSKCLALKEVHLIISSTNW